jgi:hypothetical protein
MDQDSPTPPPQPTANSLTESTRPVAVIESTPQRQRSGCFWFITGGAGCLLLLLLIVAVPVLLVPSVVGSTIQSALEPFKPRPITANVFSTQSIIQRIQPLGQLVSTSVQMAKADVYVGVTEGALNACGHSANHVVQGAVEAGIDLTRLTEADVSYDEGSDTITLTLPAAEITSCRIDFIRQYDQSATACNVDWDSERILAHAVALQSFRDDAIEGGILDRAQDEARLVFGNLVETITGKRVVIEFRPPENVTFPESCQPEIPGGWWFDPATNQWMKQ